MEMEQPRGPGEPTEYEEAVYIQRLQHQHAAMLDRMAAEHMLWCPEMLHPQIQAMGVMHTILRLNDGRECHVITMSTNGETVVTDWGRDDA